MIATGVLATVTVPDDLVERWAEETTDKTGRQ
jgi:hypothetical protein